jgi:hypothetical protein
MREHLETSSEYMKRRESERRALAKQLAEENRANPSLDTYEGVQSAAAANAAALASLDDAEKQADLDAKKARSARGRRSGESFDSTINDLSSMKGIDDAALTDAYMTDVDAQIEAMQKLDDARMGSLDKFIDARAQESQLLAESMAEQEELLARKRTYLLEEHVQSDRLVIQAFAQVENQVLNRKFFGVQDEQLAIERRGGHNRVLYVRLIAILNAVQLVC